MNPATKSIPTVKDVYQILCNHIRKKDTWETCSNEAYGAYNCDDLMDQPVKKILFCVTETDEVVEYAKSNNYDLIIAHHPFNIKDYPTFVFHTALDCCREGMNDMWKACLGIQKAKHFDHNLGWYGKIIPISFDRLCKRVKNFSNNIIGQKFIDANAPDDIIRSVCVCSGLGGMVIDAAAATKADCYIIGEATQNFENDNYGFKAMVEIGHTYSEQIGSILIKKLLRNLYIKVDNAPIEIDVFGSETYFGYPESKSHTSQPAAEEEDNIYVLDKDHTIDNIPYDCTGKNCPICALKQELYLQTDLRTKW